MVVAIDIDGFLVPEHDFRLVEGEKYYGKKPVNPDAYSLEDMFGVSKKEALMFYASNGWKNYKKYTNQISLRPGAKELIEELIAKGYKPKIFTKRFQTSNKSIFKKKTRKKLEEYLKKNGINVPVVYCEKGNKVREAIEENAIAIFEDTSEIAHSFSDSGRLSIVFDEPYNTNCTGKNIGRINHLNQGVQELERLIKEREKEISNYKDTEIWHKHYGNIPRTLDYFDGSMWEIIKQTSEKYPNYVAINYYGTKITYLELLEKINEYAKGFKAQGFEKGDRAIVAMPNTPEALISFYALNMIGVVPAMIHPKSAVEEIKSFIKKTESKHIITTDVTLKNIKKSLETDKDITSMINEVTIFPVNNSMKNKVTKLGYKYFKGGKKNLKIEDEKFILGNDVISNGKKYEGEYIEKMDCDELAVIMFSGGSTADPKGIELSNKNFNSLAANGKNMCANLFPTIRMLSIMPIFHGFGLGIGFHTAFYVGAECVTYPQFSIKGFHDFFIKHNPEVIAGVPALLEAITRNKKIKKLDLSYVKTIISGGASLSISTKEKVEKFLRTFCNCFTDVREGYGLTETVTGCCLSPLNDSKEGKIGIPYSDTIFRIIKTDSNDDNIEYAGIDETGEICISSPMVARGYFKDIKANKKSFKIHKDGNKYLHTGDLGNMDKDGFFAWEQRKDRMIITNGYNVNPSNVENALDGHPDVVLSAVIGKKDEYSGQMVKAFVVLKEGTIPSEKLKKEIINFCKKSLSTYQLPRDIEFKEELPKTLVGKVDCRKLEMETANQTDGEKKDPQYTYKYDDEKRPVEEIKGKAKIYKKEFVHGKNEC
jgi:Acyl-CoA synthetases (AMP-forming)/AMP-acid ligases II